MSKIYLTLLAIGINLINTVNAQGADCSSATSLTVNASCTTSAISVSGTDSGIAAPSCVSSINYDGWYSFVATESTTTIDLTGINRDGALAVYSDCSGTLVGGTNCANANASGVDETLTVNTTTSSTYYIRVMRANGGGGSMTGNICAYSTPSSSTCDYTLTMSDSYGDGWNGASIDIEENSSNIGNYTLSGGYTQDVTVTISDGAAIELFFNSGSYDSEINLWKIVDPFGNIICSGTTAPSVGSFCTFTSNCAGPDLPCDAVSLSPQSSTCGAITYTTYDNTGTSDSGIADPGCGNYNGGDMWFTATIPQSGGFDVLTQANGLTDMAMAIYSGSCSSLALITCSDNGNGNMPTATISGLTPGDPVFIRAWDEGGNANGTFDIVLDDLLPIYCQMGDAVDLPSAGANCVQLTADQGGQKGCVWNTSTLDLTQPFDYTLQVYLGDDDGGADGVTFSFQNDPNGPTACGNDGEYLGMGGVTNSLTIEVDTYDNNNNAWEPSYDHIAISKGGDVNDVVCGAVQASSTNVDVEDGLEHDLRVTWDPSTTTLEIYFDGVSRLICNEDIINTIFGGNSDVYWGFTSSTGGYTNQQYFCPGNLPVASLGVEFIELDVNCVNSENQISWTTLDENNINYYIVERTIDGNQYTEIGTVKADNKSHNRYDFTDESNSGSTTHYYRIKTVNHFGEQSATNVVASKCNGLNGNSLSIIANSSNSQINFFSNYPQNYNLTIHDIRGRIIWSHASISTKGENVLPVDLSILSQSVYILSYSDDQTNLSQKFILK